MSCSKKRLGTDLAVAVLMLGATLAIGTTAIAHEGAMKVTGKITAIHNGWLLELQKADGEYEYIPLTKAERLRYGRLYPGSEVVITRYKGNICDVAKAVPDIQPVAVEHREIQWAPSNPIVPPPKPAVAPAITQPAPQPVPALW